MRNFLIRDVLRDESVKYSMMRIYKSTSENPNKTINMSSFIKFADETNFDVYNVHDNPKTYTNYSCHTIRCIWGLGLSFLYDLRAHSPTYMFCVRALRHMFCVCSLRHICSACALSDIYGNVINDNIL